MFTRLFYIAILILIATHCWGQLDSKVIICSTNQQVEAPLTPDAFNYDEASQLGSKIVNPAIADNNSLFNVLDTSLWPARWNCGIWTPAHGWLYISSDLAIWLAYFAIPFILAFFYYRRQSEIPFKTVFILFIGFIVACGLTHLIDAVIFWWPAYKLSAMLRFGTALISWTTVIALVKVLPEAMEFKSPRYLQDQIDIRTSELKIANAKLQERIEAEVKLKSMNTELLEKISKQNAELVAKNKNLAQLHELFASVQSAAEMGIWEVNLDGNSVYWSDAVYKIHEIEIGTPISVEQAINFYHRDYRNIIEQAVNKAISDGTGWDLELKLVTNSNREIWVRAIGMPVVVESETVLLRGLFQDITDKILVDKKKQAINEMLEMKVKKRTIELESINKELNAFSYSVSHDLRSPLRSISGFSQALKEDYFDQLDASGKNYLERISNAAIRMGKLIDDLLNLSRISRSDVVNEQIDLTKLCKKIINETLPDPKYKFKIGTNLTVTGDIKLIKIMMENLIGNAIKYSSKVDQPLIEIGEQTVENKGEAFFIKDNGAGFDHEYSGKLFGAFQRLHSAEEFEGTGIGLATVKRIVNMHGGSIWAEGSINNGATFYFNLNN
jgi:signal transduction histidine kinase